MKSSELKFFEAIELFNDEFYWDSIEAFQESLSEGLSDEYVDDCFMNIAISFMKLKLFNEAEEYFNKAISAASKNGDQIDVDSEISGKTTDRAYLGLARISLIKKDYENATEILDKLKGTKSYILINNEKVSMYDICKKEIEHVLKIYKN